MCDRATLSAQTDTYTAITWDGDCGRRRTSGYLLLPENCAGNLGNEKFYVEGSTQSLVPGFLRRSFPEDKICPGVFPKLWAATVVFSAFSLFGYLFNYLIHEILLGDQLSNKE